MKLNLWKRWQEHRKKKKQEKQNRSLMRTWIWLEKIFESGMLSFDHKSHRLFISQPVAVLLMANGADGWTKSIHAIYQYTYFRLLQQAWEDFMQKEELAAVRNAMSSPAGDKITRDDIERIKRSRRSEIAVGDMEPPKIEPFEFFILPDSTEAKVEPLGIGYYDPNKREMEVATWEDVKSLIKTQ